MITESDRLLGGGIPITLRNGADERTFHLRYDFRALKRLEDTYGSIDQAVDALGTVGGKGVKRIGLLASFLSAGLAHEGLDDDSILDWLSLSTLSTDMALATRALAQAMPPARPSGEGTSPNVAGEHGSSPGRRSTASLSSSLVSVIESSGT